jgi:hydrogenase expression/formation protein HypC
MAIPSQVVAIEGMMATVECFGVRRDVSLMLLGDGVVLGDYLLVQAGGYAYEKIDEAHALESLALMQEFILDSPADALPEAAGEPAR